MLESIKKRLSWPDESGVETVEYIGLTAVAVALVASITLYISTNGGQQIGQVAADVIGNMIASFEGGGRSGSLDHDASLTVSVPAVEKQQFGDVPEIDAPAIGELGVETPETDVPEIDAPSIGRPAPGIPGLVSPGIGGSSRASPLLEPALGWPAWLASRVGPGPARNAVGEKLQPVGEALTNAADWVQENRNKVMAAVGLGVGAVAGFMAAAVFCGATGGLGCALIAGMAAGAIFGAGVSGALQIGANLFDRDDRTGWSSNLMGSALIGGILGAVAGPIGGLSQFGLGTEIRFLRGGGTSFKPLGRFTDFRLDWHPLRGKRIPDSLNGKSLPHYHHRGPGGIGRHRPWESRPGDAGFWTRF